VLGFSLSKPTPAFLTKAARLNEIRKDVAHKAPYFYKFDIRKYEKALKAGMGFEI
jgi:hypothetical protein